MNEQAPPVSPFQLGNAPGCTELLDEILRLISGARERVWISVAWWDARSSAGRRIGKAVVEARGRGMDVRVVLRNDASGLPTISLLRQAGVEVRPLRYIHEKELIVDDVYLMHSMNFTTAETERNTQIGMVFSDSETVDSAAVRYELLWDQLGGLELQRGAEVITRAEQLVPESWLPLLAFSTLNPFQSDVAPAVLTATGHVIVVAPTGAGKTVIGELAVLRAVKQEHRKGVWLVPARALASELSGLRDRWARHGVTVEILTGEMNLSSSRLTRADVWIATTEKFESLCRRTSLQEAVADVSCIVVDEVHLIGDPSRGATLEALLARLRLLSDSTRVVGLSATATNAGEVAQWLNADLLTSNWRPTVLVTQLVEYSDSESWRAKEQAKDEALLRIVEEVRSQDPGDSSGVGDDASILVFVGSKDAARTTACRLAGVRAGATEEETVDLCAKNGVGIHYRGGPKAEELRKRFVARKLSTLVATSGLSTGVNTPARVVIVRDLTLGRTPIEVSQIQQMSGRAGRVGHETAGYAYVLVPAGEVTRWSQAIAAGYRVDSKLTGREADAALAEIHLGNIAQVEELTTWYQSTYAAAQAKYSFSPMALMDQLASAGMVTVQRDGEISITMLGQLTVQLMIDVVSAQAIRSALDQLDIPESAEEAERAVIRTVCTEARALAERQINPKAWEDYVAGALNSRAMDTGWEEFGARFSAAVCLEALESPRQLRDLAKRDVVDEAPRYFGWVAALGRLGLATWPAIVASDICERLMTYELSSPRPTRGSGRILRFLRSLVEPDVAEEFVRERWRPSSGIVTAAEFPHTSVDDRVRSESLDRAHQGALSTSGLAVTERNGMLEVHPNITGAAENITVTVNAGLRANQATASSSIAMTVPLPDGAARTGEVSAEMLAFSRSDAVYSWVISPVSFTLDEPSPREFRLERANHALDQCLDAAIVQAHKPPRSMFRKKREAAERSFVLSLAENSGLQPVSEALTVGLDPLSALWSIREFLETRCPRSRVERDIRTPISIIRSGRASLAERAVVRFSLAREAGFSARLLEGANLEQLHCAVQIDGVYTLLDPSLPHVRLTWLTGAGSVRVVELPPRPQDPPLQACPRMPWLDEFMENHPQRP